MGKAYKQISLSERIELYRMRKQGCSMQAIAKTLQRSPSSISRELKRNSQPTKAWSGEYEPVRAQALKERRRRWDARFKLARDAPLRAHVHERLQAGWSPEQIAGALRREHGRCIISHEAIYRFIYHRSAQKDYWHRLLPQGKSRRGHLGEHGGSPVKHIQERVSIHQRPRAVDRRKRPGHWEGDLMLFARYGQAILVTHERSTRLLLAQQQPNKEAAVIAKALKKQFGALPKTLRRTLTVDNGTEFAYHYRLPHELGMATYFCDPHAPWQKGGIENAIGRMRRRLPRKTDLATLSSHKLDELVAAYNHTPRKCLAYQTPAQVFSKHLKVLHFKRECTFPPPRE
ncbi:MAG TPA: IS30 family transposase [Candidatus Acidoferrales bacterium]|nr:IS30 family transposase [Candidatus Acidoferrales bacterium]